MHIVPLRSTPIQEKKISWPEGTNHGRDNLDDLGTVASGLPTYTNTSSIAFQEKKISWPEGTNLGRDNLDDLAIVASGLPVLRGRL